jgi:hypothetical protein
MGTMLVGMVILMVPAFAVCTVITIVALRRDRESSQRRESPPL